MLYSRQFNNQRSLSIIVHEQNLNDSLSVCCSNDRCILASFWCDNYYNCTDYSDEYNCGEFLNILPTVYTCITAFSVESEHQTTIRLVFIFISYVTL